MATAVSSTAFEIDEELELKHHHGAVSVPDIDASIAWYRDVLGFDQVEQRIDIDTIPAKIAMLRRGSLRIELFEIANSAPASEDRRYPNRDVMTQGNKHLAFAVRDAHACAGELKKRGADIVWVQDFEWGSNVFIRDNAGNLIEFVQQPSMWANTSKEDNK